MTKTFIRIVGAVGLAASLLSAACGDDNTTAPATTSSTSPVTETFASIVSPLGGVSRAFSMTADGTISVTLTSAGPPSTIVMGLGLGIPISPGGCSLTSIESVAAGSTPQITVTVDKGDYCVGIVDIGNASKTGVNFVISIVHP